MIVLLFRFSMNNILSWWILFYFIAYLKSSILCFHSFSTPGINGVVAAFSLSHRILGLDFPTNVQAACFGQIVSECSSGSSLHSRDLNKNRGVCILAHGWKKSKSKKSKIGSLTCRGGWTPLKLCKSYESSTVIETRADMVYNIWWKKIIVILILAIRQIRIYVYELLPHSSSSSV